MASIETTPYGKYRVRWRAAGVQHARNFDRKADAQQFASKMSRAPRERSRDRITLEEMADEWLASARNLSAGAQQTYRRDLDRYIIPELGDLRLAQVTPAEVNRYLTIMTKRGLASSSIHRHYRTLRRLFAVAETHGRLDVNPCDTVTPPRIPHTEMRFLSAAEVDRLADTIAKRYRAWVYVAAYLGLRWSETVGLQRRRIDGRRVLVADQLVRRAGEWKREEPKTTASRRTITAPQFVADLLVEHLDTYSGAGPNGLVFVNQYGQPMGHSFQANVFKPALRRAGLDTAVRVHDLRHTSAALAIAVGAHPKALQARMGHSSIRVTLDRYGHLFDDIDIDIADRLDDLRPL